MGNFFGFALFKGIIDAGGWEALLAVVLGLIALALIVALVWVVLGAIVVVCMPILILFVDAYDRVSDWCWSKWGFRLPEPWLESNDNPDVSNVLAATEPEVSDSEKETESTKMMRGLILVSVMLIVIVCICI